MSDPFHTRGRKGVEGAGFGLLNVYRDLLDPFSACFQCNSLCAGYSCWLVYGRHSNIGCFACSRPSNSGLSSFLLRNHSHERPCQSDSSGTSRTNHQRMPVRPNQQLLQEELRLQASKCRLVEFWGSFELNFIYSPAQESNVATRKSLQGRTIAVRSAGRPPGVAPEGLIWKALMTSPNRLHPRLF